MDRRSTRLADTVTVLKFNGGEYVAHLETAFLIPTLTFTLTLTLTLALALALTLGT